MWRFVALTSGSKKHCRLAWTRKQELARLERLRQRGASLQRVDPPEAPKQLGVEGATHFGLEMVAKVLEPLTSMGRTFVVAGCTRCRQGHPQVGGWPFVHRPNAAMVPSREARSLPAIAAGSCRRQHDPDCCVGDWWGGIPWLSEEWSSFWMTGMFEFVRFEFVKFVSVMQVGLHRNIAVAGRDSDPSRASQAPLRRT
jgi:hypothetical protein